MRHAIEDELMVPDWATEPQLQSDPHDPDGLMIPDFMTAPPAAKKKHHHHHHHKPHPKQDTSLDGMIAATTAKFGEDRAAYDQFQQLADVHSHYADHPEPEPGHEDRNERAEKFAHVMEYAGPALGLLQENAHIHHMLHPFAQILGPAEMVAGGIEFEHGVHEAKTAKGVDKQAAGVLKATRGGASFLGGAGETFGVPWAAPIAAAYNAGSMVGEYGNDQIKQAGIHKNAKGESLSSSDWAAEKGMESNQAVNNFVHNHFHNDKAASIAGDIAGGITTAEQSVYGAVEATGGAVYGSIKHLVDLL
jgi:hypothetical protein